MLRRILKSVLVVVITVVITWLSTVWLSVLTILVGLLLLLLLSFLLVLGAVGVEQWVVTLVVLLLVLLGHILTRLLGAHGSNDLNHGDDEHQHIHYQESPVSVFNIVHLLSAILIPIEPIGNACEIRGTRVYTGFCRAKLISPACIRVDL